MARQKRSGGGGRGRGSSAARGGSRSGSRRVDHCKACTRQLATRAREAQRAQERRAREMLRRQRRESAEMGPFISPQRRSTRQRQLVEESLRAKYGGDPRRGFGGGRGGARDFAFDPAHFGRKKSRGGRGRSQSIGLMDMRPRGRSRGRGTAMDPTWFEQPIRHKRASVLGWQRKLKGRKPKNPTFFGHRPPLFHPVSKRRRRDPDPQWTAEPIRHARASVLGWQRRKRGRLPKDTSAFGGYRNPPLYSPVAAPRRVMRASLTRGRGRPRSRDFALDFAFDPARGSRSRGGRGRSASPRGGFGGFDRDFALDFAFDPAPRSRSRSRSRSSGRFGGGGFGYDPAAFAHDPARSGKRGRGQRGRFTRGGGGGRFGATFGGFGGRGRDPLGF